MFPLVWAKFRVIELLSYLLKHYFAQIDKEAIVINERFKGGGTADSIMGKPVEETEARPRRAATRRHNMPSHPQRRIHQGLFILRKRDTFLR